MHSGLAISNPLLLKCIGQEAREGAKYLQSPARWAHPRSIHGRWLSSASIWSSEHPSSLKLALPNSTPTEAVKEMYRTSLLVLCLLQHQKYFRQPASTSLSQSTHHSSSQSCRSLHSIYNIQLCRHYQSMAHPSWSQMENWRCGIHSAPWRCS